MKIVFTGGGTLGSVTPLIAAAQELQKRAKEDNLELEVFWLGTKTGPEKELIENYGIPFKAIRAGKLRRFFSLQNFFDLFLIKLGFCQAFIFLLKFKPDVVVSAGGFVAVPVIWAAWLLKIPCLIHQEDLRPGLANRLTAFCAKKITVAFFDSLKYFPHDKTRAIGNPVRQEILNIPSKEEGMEFFGLESNLPVLLILGGGTGAEAINQLVIEALPELVRFCQIIHLTGKGKAVEAVLAGRRTISEKMRTRYKVFEFLTKEMPYVLAAADLILSRAGMGVLTELAVLAKPVILIPIPQSHQELNADYFLKRQAAIVLDERDLSAARLTHEIKSVLGLEEELQRLSRNIGVLMPRDAGQKMAEIILDFSVSKASSLSETIRKQ